MPSARKPRAKRAPETCAELVRDIDERLEGGDALSDVWLPHEDWTALVHASLDELEANPTEVKSTEAKPEGLSERAEAFTRAALSSALDCSTDSTWEDLLEVARGYAMALEAERASVLPQVLEIAAARVRRVPVASPPSEGGYAVKVGSLWAGWAGELVRESERLVVALASDAERIALAYSSDYPAAKAVQLKTVKKATVTEPQVTVAVELGAQPEGKRLRCPRCLGDCLNETGHCTRAAGATRYKELSKLTGEERAQMRADHPAWFCDERHDCVNQLGHAGVCIDFYELQAWYAPGDPDCPSCGAGEEQEPEHAECPTCGEADGHKPADCAMREDDAPKKKRSRKTKPKQTTLLGDEPAPGEASRKLRPNRVKITDVEAEEGVPF